MNHQPFESWIFVEDELDPEQTHALQSHLHSCAHCAGLAASWQELQPVLETAPVLSPGPGFTARWQQRLVAEKLAMQRRQAWLLFGLGVGAAASFLLMLALVVLLRYGSPMELFLAFTNRVATLLFMAEAADTIVHLLSGAVPMSWWAMLALLAMGISVAWILSLQRLMAPRSVE